MQRILKIQTPDKKGLIAEITRVIFNFDVNILKNDEFVDIENNLFFMRSEMLGECDYCALKRELSKRLSQEAKIEIFEESRRKIVLFCTKESHCLGDLLIRYDSGELNAEILAVFANHHDLETLCGKFNVPFICIPSENLSRKEHEERLLGELRKFPCDYIVLAKYMRILSPQFVAEFPGKIINIHHSFLPAFVGANPYKQAYERGVKIIGATAHFVNNALDEGPIIYQDIIKINHTMSWKDMQKSGRDVEKVVLSRALNLALEEKIFICNNKTIVFA